MQAKEIAREWMNTITQHNLLSTATEAQRREFIERNIDTYNRVAAPLLEETTGEFFDLTPKGCETPAGALRVAQAMREFDEATAAVANGATELMDSFDREGSVLDSGFLEDLHQLRALIGARSRKQEAFLRAVAGAPAPAGDPPAEVQAFWRHKQPHPYQAGCCDRPAAAAAHDWLNAPSAEERKTATARLMALVDAQAINSSATGPDGLIPALS